MNISKHFGGKLIDMEPELEPGFDLNYPVPLSKELPGFSGSGSEPGSITHSHMTNTNSLIIFSESQMKNWYYVALKMALSYLLQIFQSA